STLPDLGPAATLDLNNASISFVGGVLPGTGTITNNAASGTATLTLNGTGTFSGVIQDGATASTALTVAGGPVTLSGANNYSGATTVNGGTVLMTTASSIGSGAAVINTAGALTINYGSAGYTFSNAITGTGTINLTAANASFTIPRFKPSSLAGFTGTVTIDTGFNNIYYALEPASGTTFDGSACKWVINNQNPNSFLYSWPNSGNTLVRLGELSGNGTIANNYPNASTLEVGALGTSTTFSGILKDNPFG